MSNEEDGPAHRAAMGGRIAELEALLAAGFDVDQPGSYGRTLLHYAAAHSVETTRLVLDAGADVNARHQGDDNALLDLITSGGVNLDIVDLLIERGLDIHAVAPDGKTALTWACYCGRTRLVRRLLDHNCDVKGTGGSSAKVPIVEAMRGKKGKLVRDLLDWGADPDPDPTTYWSPIKYAVYEDDDVLFDRVIALCLDATGNPPRAIHSALVDAAYRGRTAMAIRLVELGAHLNPDEGRLPLLRAAHHKRTELVRFFLDRGADIHARDGQGDTALSHAAASGHLPTVQLLLDRGAVLDIVNSSNWNPLMQAVVDGHLEVARHLLELGARTDFVDQEKGVTVVSIARAGRSRALVELLEAHGAKERAVAKRVEGQELFSILDCEICEFLPYKKDIGRAPQEHFPLLNQVHVHNSEPDRYTTYTVWIYRCETCGTHYQHDYLYDAEDAHIGGPNVSQHMQRFNLEHLQIALAARGLVDELDVLRDRLPKLLEAGAEIVRARGSAAPEHIWRWALDCRLDQLLLDDDWDTIEAELLGHADPMVAVQTVHDLVMAHSEKSYGSGAVQMYRTFRHTTVGVRERAVSIVDAHNDAIAACLNRLSPLEKLAARVDRVRKTAAHYGVVSGGFTGVDYDRR